MVKLLANENFPTASVTLLHQLGYDIKSIGRDYSGISDRSVLEIAKVEQRTILTFDRDYGELIHKYGYRPEYGVVYLRLDEYEPDMPGRLIHGLLHEREVDVLKALTVFDGTFVRQRKY